MDGLSAGFSCAPRRGLSPMAAWEYQLHQRRGLGNICRRWPSRFRTYPACHPGSSAPGPRGSVFRPAFAESQEWIVQPLRGEWNEGRKKDDNSPNRPRNGHVSLPLDAVYMLLQYASKPTFSSIFAKVLAAKCANDANGPHAINPVGNDRNSVRPIRVIRALRGSDFWVSAERIP